MYDYTKLSLRQQVDITTQRLLELEGEHFVDEGMLEEAEVVDDKKSIEVIRERSAFRAKRLVVIRRRLSVIEAKLEAANAEVETTEAN